MSHVMKFCGGRGGTAPNILNCGCKLGKLKVFWPMSHVMKFCGGRGGTAPHILHCGCRLRPVYTHRNAVLHSLPAKWGGGENLSGCACKARNLSLLRTWDLAVHLAAVLLTGWVIVSYVMIPIVIKGRDSWIGTVTRYGLDSPGIESRCGRDFPHPSRPALRPTQPHLQWVPGPSRVKAAGRCVDHPPQLAPRLKKEYSINSTPPLGLRGLL
jgi:hypothetical protein